VNLLRTERLQKSFGSLVVTKDVDLAVDAGERHVIIGPNGAGKTSLINQIGGQLKPTSGRIYLRGQDITDSTPEQVCRFGVGRTFQKNNLFRGLSARENVRLALQVKNGTCYNAWSLTTSQRWLWERVDNLLEQVHLSGDMRRPVSTLSYGEQRQLEIAIALACEPALLLLDEPTSGMSPAETERMIDLIRELPSTLGLLIIEHDMNVVFSLADRITVLHYGEVLASGTPADISSNDTVQAVYLGKRKA